MINKKNIYSIVKTKKFFEEYPLILLYQHNNLTVKQHIDLKIQIQSLLSKSQENLETIKILTVKNSIIEKVFTLSKDKVPALLKKDRIQKNTENNQFTDSKNTLAFSSVLQGPLFLLGCQNREQVQSIWNVLKSRPSFLFLGCKSNNQIYTHLDMEKSLQLNNTIYYDFLFVLDNHLRFQDNGFLWYRDKKGNNSLLQTQISNYKLFSLLCDPLYVLK